MKKTHKQKVKIAKKMGRTKEDNALNAPLFMTEGWERRKLAIKLKVNKKILCSKQKKNQKLKK